MMAFAHHGINSVYTWMKIINPCSQRRRKSNRSVAYNFDSFFIRKSRIRKKLFRVKFCFAFSNIVLIHWPPLSLYGCNLGILRAYSIMTLSNTLQHALSFAF